MLSVSYHVRSFHISVLAPGERAMTVEALMISSEKLWKEVELIQDCRKDLVMPFFKKRNAGKILKNYRPVISAFISGHKYLEDKITNMQHQVVVSNPKALAIVSADVQRQKYQGRSMSQGDGAIPHGTGTLWAVIVPAHRRGLLVREATLGQFPDLPGWGTYGTTLQPPSNQDPALPFNGGGHGNAGKKSGDKMCRKRLGRHQGGALQAPQYKCGGGYWIHSKWDADTAGLHFIPVSLIYLVSDPLHQSWPFWTRSRRQGVSVI